MVFKNALGIAIPLLFSLGLACGDVGTDADANAVRPIDGSGARQESEVAEPVVDGSGPGEVEPAKPGPGPAGTEITPPPVDASRPMALHFAMLQRAPGTSKMPDGALTAKLRASTVENVLVTSGSPRDVEPAAWGAAIARHTPARVIDDPARTDTLLAHINDVPGLLRQRLAEGYTYLAIDELEPEKSDFLVDSDPRSDIFVEALRAMNADPTLRHRVILYANSYNMAGGNFNDFERFSKVLRACRDFCRIVASEMYLGTEESFSRGAAQNRTATSKGGCANGVDCIGFVVNKMDAVAPGIKPRTITILGVSAAYMKGSAANAYCNGKGGLSAQLAKVRSLNQPGVGTYSLAAVAGDVPLPGFTATTESFATCVHDLLEAAPFSLVAAPAK